MSSGISGVLLRPDVGTLRVTGPDRVSWLNGLITADVAACTPNEAVWSLALDRKGKIQSELWVLDAGDALLVGATAGTTPALAETLEKLLIMEDCELSDVSPDWSWSLVVGTQAPGQVPAGAVWGTMPAWGLPVSALCLPKESAAAWLATQSRLDEEQWLELRLEANLPSFGVDYGFGKDRPHEAGLERRTVSWSKGCYLGQEVVCMQDMRGKVSRSVRRLLVHAPRGAALSAGTRVLIDGEDVAPVTSIAYSASRDGWLVLAQLPLAKLEAGMLQLAGAEATYPAQLSDG